MSEKAVVVNKEAAKRAADKMNAWVSKAIEDADAELAYYRRSTCACTAAERYMWDCPKHGLPSPDGGG